MSPRLLLAQLALLLCLVSLSDCRRHTTSQDAGAQGSASSSAAAPSASSSSTLSDSQAARPAFLWKIDLNPPSYLLGTIHLPDPRVSALADSVLQALKASDKVLTEIPLDAATQVAMTPLLMLPKGKTLRTELPADLYQRLERLFLSKGLPLEPLSSLKIWAIAAQVVLIDRLLAFAIHKPLDAQLYERAQTSGKEVGSLETPQEQVAAFDGLTRAEQIHMLKKTLDQMDQYAKEGKDPIERLLLAWLSANEEKMQAALLEEYDANDPVDTKIMKRVLQDRNEVMAKRILEQLRTSPKRSHFFAVGTAHLLGEGSVVERLKKQGYRVARTPVNDAGGMSP